MRVSASRNGAEHYREKRFSEGQKVKHSPFLVITSVISEQPTITYILISRHSEDWCPQGACPAYMSFVTDCGPARYRIIRSVLQSILSLMLLGEG